MVFWVCASELFAFALAASSDGMPRAVKRAGELWRPQRRAGLETFCVATESSARQPLDRDCCRCPGSKALAPGASLVDQAGLG